MRLSPQTPTPGQKAAIGSALISLRKPFAPPARERYDVLRSAGGAPIYAKLASHCPIDHSFGYHKSKSKIIVNEKGLLNNGINFGISIPMISSRSLSRLNLGFELGRLGDLELNNIEENYFNFSIGFSLAPDTRYDRWFRKRKYD